MAVWYKGLPQGGGMAGRQDVNYLMLYDAGDECTEVTGGWGSDGYRHISTMATLDVEKLSDSIKIRNTQNGQCRVFGISNEINLSGYGEIGVIGSNSLPSVAAAAVYVSAKKTYIYDSGIVNSTIVSSNGIISRVDVSAVDKGYVSLICGYTGGVLEIGVSAIFLAKADDWQSWLLKAGLTVSDYGSLDAVIADHTALTTLMSSKAAVDYMLHHCTGTVMAAVIQSQDALEAIADSPYNAGIFKNEHWNKFLRMVGAVPESEKTYLFKDGVENTEATGTFYKFPIADGGLGVDTNGTLTRADKYVEISKSDGGGYNYVVGTKSISLAGYSKVCARIAVMRKGNNSNFQILKADSGIYSDLLIEGIGIHNIRFTPNTPLNEIIQYTIDVSDLALDYHIAFNVYNDAIRVYRFWLEK